MKKLIVTIPGASGQLIDQVYLGVDGVRVADNKLIALNAEGEVIAGFSLWYRFFFEGDYDDEPDAET